ncbi:fimbrillin family protein [Bacteroides heparinolyticus]|uniref:fimbrillin family protein n=1 Tax=Prevotella heparinolytica TaxID=28113 RepID=UPI003F9FFB78
MKTIKTMRQLFCAGLALLALAACSQDETTRADRSGAIGFRTMLGKATRAVTTKANMGKFNVTAFPTGGTNYFTNLEVASLDNGATWNTAATYYWPAGTLNFTAYAPVDIKTLVTIDKDGQKIAAYSPVQKVADQKDIVVAFNAGGKTTYGATGVPMNFKHALSQIEVKAKCTNGNLKVKVMGVKLGAVNSKADFAFPQAETNSSYNVPRSNWTGLASSKDYLAEDATSTGLTLDGTEKSIMFGSDNFLMIPQQLEAFSKTKLGGAYIGVFCQISSDDGEGNLTQIYPGGNANAYAFTAVGIDTEWLPGKKYIYTLTFGDGGGIVPPNQENPNAPTITPPTPPTPPNPSTPGDPILDKPIKFTVTVDNWTDQSESVNM